jgi:hypothetical protein
MTGMAVKTRKRTRGTTAAVLALAVAGMGVAGAGLLAPNAAAEPLVRAAATTTTAHSTAGSTMATIKVSTAAKKKLVKSNVSQMRRLGVIIGAPVLIDVTDDGLDRYLAVGTKGRVDFTGTERGESTQMSMQAAYVPKKAHPAKNRVVIKPDWYNEDLGPAQCVTDVKEGVLKLKNCKKGASNQAFKLTPFGDAGAFEMIGRYTHIEVNNGKITTNNDGYVGLQTIDFVED